MVKPTEKLVRKIFGLAEILSDKGFTVVIYLRRTKKSKPLEIEISKGEEGIGFYGVETKTDFDVLFDDLLRKGVI